jgi:MFS transporter, FSR family, fosmidomycin resistance protein
VSTERLDRRGLAVLATGHLWADFLQGSVPALLPFLIAERGYSYGAAGALLLASSLGSSIVQPLFGLASDRLALPWLMPFGLALGGVGLATVGLTQSYPATAAAVLVSGLGVAAFHPEAARYANYASRAQRGRGMSMFSLGGNAGFALGPLLVTPAVLAFGLPGTLLALIPLWLAAALLFKELGRLRGHAPAAPAGNGQRPAAGVDEWGAFARLASVVGLRSAVFFGLQAFVPIYFAVELGTSKAVGNGALSVMLVAGAVGTYVGGRLMDRVGRRVILVASMGALSPLLVAFLLAGRWPASVLLLAIGFATIANFSVTIVMGQEYLPNRLGLASGVTMGAAIGAGGLAAAALGALADHTSLTTALWTIAVIPLPAVLIALTLPPTATDRRLKTQARSGRTDTQDRSIDEPIPVLSSVASEGHSATNGNPPRDAQGHEPPCASP